jgi:F-type H+-transporting ATPase subunit b
VRSGASSLYATFFSLLRKKSMDATLHALGDLLIKAIPTAIFFIFLTVYLQKVFFKPMARILEERRKQTEGVRELAQRALEAADRKTSEFEHALQLARAEMHAEHEKLRRQWIQEQTERIAQARAEADRQIEEARQQISAEVQKAEAEIANSVNALSEQIVTSLLRRRAA